MTHAQKRTMRGQLSLSPYGNFSRDLAEYSPKLPGLEILTNQVVSNKTCPKICILTYSPFDWLVLSEGEYQIRERQPKPGDGHKRTRPKRLFTRENCVWLAVNHYVTTLVSLLANEFDVRSALHWQVSLAAVNQAYVIHEAMNGCKNLCKDSLKTCLENIDMEKSIPVIPSGGFLYLLPIQKKKKKQTKKQHEINSLAMSSTSFILTIYSIITPFDALEISCI